MEIARADGADPGDGGALSIGELAEAVGLPAATIRSWERRYGFPSPRRRTSGHRRYGTESISTIRGVLRARDRGVSLPMAIAGLRAGSTDVQSIFAQVRDEHPDVPVMQARKSTLLALTRAIEDECCARGQQPLLFGAFQHQRFFEQAERRWRELARTSWRTVVFAATDHEVAGDRIDFVTLPDTALMRREWTVVCDAPDAAALLAAWELPGQAGRPDAERVFEALWTVDPVVVRSGARAGAVLAGIDTEGPVEERLGRPTTPASSDAAQVLRTFSRMVGYLDRDR